MNTTSKKTKEELQYEITSNHRLHTAVQSVERFKEFHFETYMKYFSDKEYGFIPYDNFECSIDWYQTEPK